MSTRSTDALVGFHFSLEAQGTIMGFFTDISGLGSENEIVEQKVVGPNGVQAIQKIPGRLKFTDITLKRGITDNMDLWAWRKLVEEGKTKTARKNATITAYANDLTPVAQWDFVNMWPSKVSGPTFNSEQSNVTVEEVTLVHEGYKRTK